MNLQEIKYDAFISYRHCELDQFVATTLHKELEAFRLPKAIAKQLQAKGITRKKIERVFRDRDELPITNNLADPITNALQNSDFLLVICSPRLRESLWCRKEIETFIKMHGREHIFAVLIEGEPADSFPEELLYEEKITVDENGNEHVEKVSIEPLAADVRGKNRKEIRKKIKEEVLRLAAPMFDCSYDDLKQRHRERAIRKIIAIAGGISAVFATFGIVSSIMAYRINEQSIQIKEQSVQIQEQADRINVQYQEALRANAKQMAEDSFDLLERGDVDAAKETAYQALAGEMPYTSEAEYALSSALQVYRNGSQIGPTRLLKNSSQISFCKTSPDMTKLMIVDIFKNIGIYDPLTGELLHNVEGNDMYLSEGQAGFVGNHSIVYSTGNGFAVYDLDTGLERSVETDSVYLFRVDKNGRYLFAKYYDEIDIYDVESLQSVYHMESEEGISFALQAMFSCGDKEFLVMSYTKEDLAGVYIIDMQTQEVVNYLTDSKSITSMWVEDEYIYMTAYAETDTDTTEGFVYCISTDGKLIWKYTLEGMPDDIISFGVEDDKIAIVQYNRLIVLSKDDGSYVCETSCGREIVNYASYTESDTLVYLTRDGEYHYFLTDSNTDMVIEGKFVTNSDNIMNFIFGKNFYVSASYSDSAAAVYETVIGPDVTEFIDISEEPTEVELSEDEKYLVSHFRNDGSQMIVIVDTETKDVIHEIATGMQVYDISITKNNELMVLHRNGVLAYDLVSGRLLFERETETSNEFFVRNGEAYVGTDLLDFYMCDTKTGDVLFTIEDSHLLQRGLFTSDIDDTGEWYAYSSEEEKKLVLGTMEKGDIRTLDVNINAIEVINLEMQEQVVYLTYLDESVEVYDINTGKFVRRYENLFGGVTDVKQLQDNKGTILITPGGAYLLNADKEVIAYIQGFKEYISSFESFILSKYNFLYEVPYYSVDELLELVH